ncbi:hypothetical protein [Sellimonas intestinalis]|uniref:hypothetical protein n=1 Tax=Sellimonas intestinalis TaxID=1653434 RepID=UPI003AB484D6
MSIIKFKDLNFRSDKEYSAVIQKIEINRERGKLYIFVELEDEPGITYLKSITYSEHLQGALAKFFDGLQVMNRRNEVDTEELEGKEVIVTFNKGRDGNYYVKEMWMVEEESDDVRELDDYECDDEDDLIFDEDEE